MRANLLSRPFTRVLCSHLLVRRSFITIIFTVVRRSYFSVAFQAGATNGNGNKNVNVVFYLRQNHF